MIDQDYREVVVSDGGTQLIRVAVASDHVIDSAIPPKCGSCSKLIGGKCRSSGIQAKRAPGDVGCSDHPSWQLFELVASAISTARQGNVNSAARVLSEQTAAATPGQVTWLDTCEAGGEFSPVKIIGQEAGDTTRATSADRNVAWQGVGPLTPETIAAGLMKAHWQ